MASEDDSLYISIAFSLPRKRIVIPVVVEAGVWNCEGIVWGIDQLLTLRHIDLIDWLVLDFDGGNPFLHILLTLFWFLFWSFPDTILFASWIEERSRFLVAFHDQFRSGKLYFQDFWGLHIGLLFNENKLDQFFASLLVTKVTSMGMRE